MEAVDPDLHLIDPQLATVDVSSVVERPPDERLADASPCRSERIHAAKRRLRSARGRCRHDAGSGPGTCAETVPPAAECLPPWRADRAHQRSSPRHRAGRTPTTSLRSRRGSQTRSAASRAPAGPWVSRVHATCERLMRAVRSYSLSEYSRWQADQPLGGSLRGEASKMTPSVAQRLASRSSSREYPRSLSALAKLSKARPRYDTVASGCVAAPRCRAPLGYTSRPSRRLHWPSCSTQAK